MECKIRVRDLAVYHPSDIINNDYYIEHFKQQGKDIRSLLTKVLGRENRYVIQNEGKEKAERENSLTMQIKAAKLVLEKSNLTGKDIDGIIVATQFPEYMVPPSFMRIHAEIEAKTDCFGYDMNVNCLGMTMAFQQASQYFMCNEHINRILIIGGDYLTIGVADNDENFYGAFGDSACAIIVERSEESKIIDLQYYINNESIEMSKFPNCGLSQIVEKHDMNFMSNQDHAPNCEIDLVAEKIKQMLEKNNMTVDDISGFCFSQFVKHNNEKLMNLLHISEEKCPYVGNEFGYTGVNSPFLALNSLMMNHKINRGDYVFIWTIGTGLQHVFMLIKY